MPGSLIWHMRKAEQQVDKTEILANLGVIFAGIIGILAGYFTKRTGKPPASQDAVVASVGLEFGNRMQMDELIIQTKRGSDALVSAAASLAILADRKQADIEDKLDELLERVDRPR